MTNNAENPIEMIYSSPPDDEKSHPRLDASTTPSRVHCPKCQVDVVPKHRGLCPGCGRFLSSNKLAQRYFEDTSARKKHLDKLLSEFQPSTVEANFACEMLANNRAELEHARCGTPEHQRLITSSLELFAILKASKVPQQPAPLEHLSNAELADRALMLADRAVELMREAPPPSVDARPESSPIVSVSPREEAPHLDDAAPVDCQYCRLTVAQCRATKDAHVPTWRSLHWNDPQEIQRRSEIATREMMHQVGKPLPTWYR